MRKTPGTPHDRPVLSLALAAAILLIFCSLGWWFIHANSQTSDEAVHLAAGYSYLATGDFRLNPEHPPLIKLLSALPIYLSYHLPWGPNVGMWERALTQTGSQWLIGRDFLYHSAVAAETLLIMGRLFNLLLGTLLVALIGWWSYRLWGRGAALLAMALAALEPNLIAHSSLVTTDLGPTLFIFLAAYLFWEYLRRPTWGRLLGIGLATGLALVSKFSAILLLPLLVLITLLECLGGDAVHLPNGATGSAQWEGALLWRHRASAAKRLRQAVLVAASICLVAALVIPVSYLFQGYSTWWEGLLDVVLHQQEGHRAFFLGEYSSTGWWNYFLVAFLIKTPLGTLACVGMSLGAVKIGTRLTWREAGFLILPVLVVLSVMTRARIDIGLRHVLPIYPFLLVLAGRVATFRFSSRAVTGAVIGIPLLVTAQSTLRIAPHQLAYFNEAIGGPARGLEYLSDSNIDWGQDLWQLRDWVKSQGVEPIYLGYFGNAPVSSYGFSFQQVPSYGGFDPAPPDEMPLGGGQQFLAVSVLNLHGTFFQDHDLYRWLRARTPVARIGYSIYVYNIARDADAHFQLARGYLTEGPDRYAIPELQQALAINPQHRDAAALLSQLQEMLQRRGGRP